MIERKAYAKINLSLDVTGVLPNGYHEVRMVMQTIDLYDILTFEEFETSAASDCGASSRIRLASSNCGELSLGEDNLIFKAAKALMPYIPSGKGVSINLKKNIPMAAGMAGGSTDAAATLRGINELFRLGLSDDKLCELGVKLGADVPYCIMGGTMLAEGIGEKLSRLPDCPLLNLVVAKPPMGVSTKYVYEHLDACENPKHPDVNGMLAALDKNSEADIALKLGNILELVTIPACPEVAAIKKLLAENGAEGVLMSGSGPTVFAIFKNRTDAEAAADRLKNSSISDIFVCVTTTRNRDID